jgi:inosine triphosphate pyrophosphatase
MIFITSNHHKLLEYQYAIPDIRSYQLELIELQAQTVEEITKSKVEEAFSKLQQACFVEDVSLEIDILGGFPGPYVKWFIARNTPQHIASITSKLNQSKALAKAVIGLKMNEDTPPIVLVGQVSGQIVTPRGESEFGFDNIFQPDGSTKTFGEMTEEEKHTYSHRSQAISLLQKFLKNHDAKKVS